LKIRGLLTAGAVLATVAGAAIAGQGSASAVTSAKAAPLAVGASGAVKAGHPVPASAFKSVTGHVTASRPSGITPTTTARFAPGGRAAASAGAGTATTSCTEPNCNVSYQGGLVQQSPTVYVVFWGPEWTGSDASAATYLQSFYSGLGASGDNWSTMTSRYGDGSGNPAFGSSMLAGTVNDTSTPPDPLTYDDIANEAANALNDFSISDTNDAQIVVAVQSGTCYENESGLGLFAGSCGQEQTGSGYCAYHSTLSSVSDPTGAFLPFVVLPYQTDAGSECGENFINTGSAGTFDGFSMVAGHEYAETITDPNQYSLSTLGWIDVNDGVSGGEIADKCAWGGEPFGVKDAFGNVTLSTGTFAMQSLWINGTSGGRCMMNPPTLTVATPPTQTATLGRGFSLQIGVTTNAGAPSFKAAGLPPGLSIGSTGKISGTPNTTAGAGTATVTVTDFFKSVSVKFGWQVGSAPGFIVGYGSKCVDDYYGRTTAGNKIDLYACNGGTGQQVTFTFQHHLQVQGQCVSGASIDVYLEPCSSSTNEAWTRQSNGEYSNWATGKCLTDPGNSTTNSIQLQVAACKNTANQHWGLPVSLVGAVKGYDSKCVDDYFGRTTAGNKVDLYSCTGGSPQRITLAAGSQLHVQGQCVTAGSIDVYIYPCTSTASKVWTYQPSGEWVNAATGKCLTDPGNSTTNGTQLQVTACKNTADQHWTLP
jgi:3D (Asp-Asp-Asp) domain-containing protein